MAVKLYEGMFVVDAARGGARFEESVRHIAQLLTRQGAEIERVEKWDERKLAYPIQHVKRGIYILVYFRADGPAITEIRLMTALSEQVLRVLILRVEEPGPVKGQLYSPEGQLLEQPEETPEAPETEEAEGPETEQTEEQEAEEPVKAEGDA